jgi:hypothetical protein
MTYDYSSLATTLELPIPALLAAAVGPPQARVDDPNRAVPSPDGPGTEVPVPGESEIEDPARKERDA